MTVLTKAYLGSTLLSSVYLGATQLLGGGGSEFAFGGFEPAYLLDFVNDPSGAESALAFSRASTAMMRNSSGEWVSVGINEPRIGHHEWDGSEWVNKGLLKEGQATNFLKYSEDFSNSIWVARGFTKAGPASGPMGATAYEFVEDGTSTNPAIYYNADATDGTPRAFSIWLKASTPVTIALTTQSDTKSREINVTTEWKFFWVSDSLNAAIGPHIGGFSTISVGSGLRIWAAMPQQEDAPTPSSYIPTNGSAVTRAADVMTQPAGTLPWSASALSLFMSGEVSGDSYTLLSWQADAGNRIAHTLNTSDFTFAQAAAGTVDSITGGSHTSGLGVPFAYAATHASTGIYAAVNGVALTPDETPTALADLTGAATNLLPSGNYTIAAIAGWAVDIGDTGRLEGSNYGS